MKSSIPIAIGRSQKFEVKKYLYYQSPRIYSGVSLFRSEIPAQDRESSEHMQTYIAILRGINVSGQKIIKMVELRDHLSSLGFSNLTTYIQSGNIVFQSELGDNHEIEEIIYKKILEAYGFNVPVIVRSLEEWKQVVDEFPFKDGLELNRLCVTFLKHIPTDIPYEEIDKFKAKNDEVVIKEKSIYLYIPGGFGKSKLSNTTIERKLKVKATTRNWKTTTTLLEMANKL